MREIRSYGSVRGVRSNPYPYRDIPKPDAEGSANTITPKNTFRAGKNTTSTVAESPHLRVRNRPRIHDGIWRLNGPGSGRGSGTRSGQESATGNTSGSAAKEKSFPGHQPVRNSRLSGTGIASRRCSVLWLA
jgi:hypothetical protein